MVKEESAVLFHFICLALCAVVGTKTWAQDNLINPLQLEMFVDQLPEMPTIQGFDLVNGVPVSKSLDIGMYEKTWKFHRDLPPSLVFAFGTSNQKATVPGPTIDALYGVDTYVTWQNYLPSKHILPWDPTIPTAMPSSGVPTVVHLHGTIGEPESDGHAAAWFTNGFKAQGPTWTQKQYHYLNFQQPGTMWYHDHAKGLTRVNLLAGLVGAYILRQPDVEIPLGLPCGPEYDRPLMVFDRSFRTNGSIYMNSTGNNPSIHPQWQPEYFGDVIVVNGKAWPYMVVQRRKYRFRIINASNARFYNFYFTNGTLGFIHIGSDSAYHQFPVVLQNILLAPSEIADVIINFSNCSGSVILANVAPFPYPTGDPVNQANGKVMKFIIQPNQQNDTSRVPDTLIKYPVPDISTASLSRYITMYEYTSNTGEPTHMFLNAKTFEDPVTETPKVGTTEVWYVINLTGDNHPLHIHLGLFVVLDQTQLVNITEFSNCMAKNNDAIKCQIGNYTVGQKIQVPAHESGWKNVFKMMPGYVTRILLRFSYIQSNASYIFNATSEPGYVYHCHILDHEDNVMMRPMKLIS